MSLAEHVRAGARAARDALLRRPKHAARTECPPPAQWETALRELAGSLTDASFARLIDELVACCPPRDAEAVGTTTGGRLT